MPCFHAQQTIKKCNEEKEEGVPQFREMEIKWEKSYEAILYSFTDYLLCLLFNQPTLTLRGVQVASTVLLAQKDGMFSSISP